MWWEELPVWSKMLTIGGILFFSNLALLAVKRIADKFIEAFK